MGSTMNCLSTNIRLSLCARFWLTGPGTDWGTFHWHQFQPTWRILPQGWRSWSTLPPALTSMRTCAGSARGKHILCFLKSFWVLWWIQIPIWAESNWMRCSGTPGLWTFAVQMFWLGPQLVIYPEKEDRFPYHIYHYRLLSKIEKIQMTKWVLSEMLWQRIYCNPLIKSLKENGIEKDILAKFQYFLIWLKPGWKMNIWFDYFST